MVVVSLFHFIFTTRNVRFSSVSADLTTDLSFFPLLHSWLLFFSRNKRVTFVVTMTWIHYPWNWCDVSDILTWPLYFEVLMLIVNICDHKLAGGNDLSNSVDRFHSIYACCIDSDNQCSVCWPSDVIVCSWSIHGNVLYITYSDICWSSDCNSICPWHCRIHGHMCNTLRHRFV